MVDWSNGPSFLRIADEERRSEDIFTHPYARNGGYMDSASE
jgi:hypothetical protein